MEWEYILRYLPFVMELEDCELVGEFLQCLKLMQYDETGNDTSYSHALSNTPSQHTLSTRPIYARPTCTSYQPTLSNPSYQYAPRTHLTDSSYQPTLSTHPNNPASSAPIFVAVDVVVINSNSNLTPPLTLLPLPCLCHYTLPYLYHYCSGRGRCTDRRVHKIMVAGKGSPQRIRQMAS